LALLFSGDSIGYAGVTRLSGAVEKESAMGAGILGNGAEFKWTSKRTAALAPEAKKDREKKSETPAAVTLVYPAGGFGRSAPPEQPKNLLVRGATIWTSGPQGKIENGDLFISAGKIVRVGQNLSAPADAVIIDAKGKHLTPGLIDAHSHSAAGSINEGAQAVTSEVRISDVIDCDDISIYRQLAGGLTTAHTMHGSANPIGGQNQTMKWRWGAGPEGLKFAETPPTIKFALGENVKQSNSQRPTNRYPQTRMGVEQLIRDRFKAARDYKKAFADYDAKIKTLPAAQRDAIIPPRRDLELDALVEILDGKRFIHCHSYVQSEILMMTRVARDFGFKLGTFQHVLEGYKVADEIAKYAFGGSCFSDWWAYKFEVYDAIPYNGALMRDAGVVVSFNSDSGELARRMNLEAAKAVKYGNVPEQEALKFVTLNPAKQLKSDQYVGSLEPGKHADFTIWSGDPLSTYSICEQTWIEGRKYFDRAEDLKMREEVNKTRELLIQKVLAAKKEGGRETREMRRPAGHSLDVAPFSDERGQDECEKP
jgi:N-acetylglucosamine-6-phosphate deacetylase